MKKQKLLRLVCAIAVRAYRLSIIFRKTHTYKHGFNFRTDKLIYDISIGYALPRNKVYGAQLCKYLNAPKLSYGTRRRRLFHFILAGTFLFLLLAHA